MPALSLAFLTSASDTSRSFARYLSEKPSCLAFLSTSSEGTAPFIAMRASSSCTSSNICSMKYFLILVRLYSSSMVAPLRSASYMMNCLSLEGLFKRLRSSFKSISWKVFAKPKPYLPVSRLLIAFWNASL